MFTSYVLLLLSIDLIVVYGMYHGLRPGGFLYDGQRGDGLFIVYDVSEDSQVSMTISCDGRLAVPPGLPGYITRNLTRTGDDNFKVDCLKGEPQLWYKQIENVCPKYKLKPPVGLDSIMFYPTNVAFMTFFGRIKVLKMLYGPQRGGVYAYVDQIQHFGVTFNITIIPPGTFNPNIVNFEIKCLQNDTHKVLPFGPYELILDGWDKPRRISYPKGEVMKIYDTIHTACPDIGGLQPGDLLDVGFATIKTIYVNLFGSFLPLTTRG